MKPWGAGHLIRRQEINALLFPTQVHSLGLLHLKPEGQGNAGDAHQAGSHCTEHSLLIPCVSPHSREMSQGLHHDWNQNIHDSHGILFIQSTKIKIK